LQAKVRSHFLRHIPRTHPPNDISKLEDDIHKTEQLVNDLDPKTYPKELTDVVLYLRDLQSFWLWLTQQELAFLKSGKLPPTEYNGLDLVACQVPVDKTHGCTQIFFGWHSCANSEMAKRLGSYPKRKMESFLGRFWYPRKTRINCRLSAAELGLAALNGARGAGCRA
jgi:hypothetical protein